MNESEIPVLELAEPKDELPAPSKTTRQQIIERITREIASLSARLEAASRIPGLDDICVPAYVFGSTIDFDCLSHPEIVKVIAAIGGKWDKTLNPGDKIKVDYQTEVEGQTIRCWAGEPPPNCRIEEVDEIVPAQPATTVKKKRLVCNEPQRAEPTAVNPTEEPAEVPYQPSNL